MGTERDTRQPGSPRSQQDQPGNSIRQERKLAEVRAELRRRGYLEHRVDRFLLQDALRPERPFRTLGLLMLKVAVLAGAPLALMATLVFGASNGLLESRPFELLPLFLHLLPGLALTLGLAFAALGGLLALTLRFTHARRLETLAFALALATATTALLLSLWQGRSLLAAASAGRLVVLFLLLLLLAYALVKVVNGGLLSLAVRLTDRAPSRLGRRRWLALGLLLVAVLVMLPVLLEVRAKSDPGPASLPLDPQARVLLLGVDGMMPGELSYLLSRGELPALQALLDRGAQLLEYQRPSGPPAAFWTTVATGLDPDRHGVGAVDSFRPVGLGQGLIRNGWLRFYWAHVGVPLGLVEHRPVLSQQRDAYTLWELASRGGRSALAVNWWGTFPAVAESGLVVAHGAYQLLEEGVPGAVAPEASREALVREREDLYGIDLAPSLAAELDDLLHSALLPDAYYTEVFVGRLERGGPAAALYLPALDIAAHQGIANSVVMADLVRWQMGNLNRVLAAAEGFDTIAVVMDPGRRGGDRGRVLLWRRGGCVRPKSTPSATSVAEPSPRQLDEVQPAAIASGLLRALALPQSAELPAPPPSCNWPAPSLDIASFGSRAARRSTISGDEYLESLRSLGYL